MLILLVGYKKMDEEQKDDVAEEANADADVASEEAVSEPEAATEEAEQADSE